LNTHSILKKNLSGFLVVLALILAAPSFGCLGGSSLKGDDEDIVIPDDFYFIYEAGYSPDNLCTLLDTKEEIIGKNLGLDGYVSKPYSIPRKNLKDVYDLIIRYGIQVYNSSDLLTDRSVDVSPRGYYKFTFYMDDKTYVILWDNSVVNPRPMSEYANLARFYYEMNTNYYVSTHEFQSFPEAVGLLG